MPIAVYEFLMTSAAVFAALMILVRFAFYRRHDGGMAPVRFWGSCLFLIMAVSDTLSFLFYRTEPHILLSLFFLAAALLMFAASRKQQAKAAGLV